mmetsp:Transcript_99969/g.280066  ORF Transcript_99969/g.280066 Transcript_99969/m.280066 type:complete len:222 (+) Transcript_99969:1146-1811(+)
MISELLLAKVPLVPSPVGVLLLQAQGLQCLNLSVHVVDVREQGVVLALQEHEDLDDLLYVGDASRLLDRGEGLLEQRDRLLVLLDMPPLDAVEEGRLHDPSHHGGLAEVLLLGRHDQAPLLLHAVLGPLQPHLKLLLAGAVVLQALSYVHDLLLEGGPLALPLALHHRQSELCVVLHREARDGLLADVGELRRALPDLDLQSLEDAVELQPPAPQPVDLLL